MYVTAVTSEQYQFPLISLAVPTAHAWAVTPLKRRSEGIVTAAKVRILSKNIIRTSECDGIDAFVMTVGKCNVESKCGVGFTWVVCLCLHASSGTCIFVDQWNPSLIAQHIWLCIPTIGSHAG